MSKRKTWRCFHCDAVFLGRARASEHFGSDESRTPACKLAGSDEHLIVYIRKLEDDLEMYRQEDSDALRAMYAKDCENIEAVRDAAERGYDKGVLDLSRVIDKLQG